MSISHYDVHGAQTIHIVTASFLISLQVEVCTEFACLKSEPTEGTTAESAPAGISVPSLVVQGAETVSISWDVPANPNGIILRYDRRKQVFGSCNR